MMASDGDMKEPETKTHKVISLISKTGDNNLQVTMRLTAECGPNDVAIRVKFCGLNFAECMQRQGLYSATPPLPTTPGYECSGVVERVGSDVTSKKPGDRVIGLTNFGAWQEVLVIDDSKCFKIPDSMTLEHAAAIPVNYLTASIMLFDQACVREGQSVFVHMAAGGVGVAVGQLCRTVKDVTVFGTASAPKHESCIKNGITHPIDYKTKDYVQEIRAISPRGVDIVLDPKGGPDSKKSHELLKPLGKHIHYGASNMVTGSSRSITNLLYNFYHKASYTMFSLMGSNKVVGGLHVGVLMQDPENYPITARHMESLIQMYADGKICPVVDSVWPFEKVLDAMNVIYERKNVGKVLLTPDDMAESK